MNLLFVVGNIAGHGGTERATCELANALTEGGTEIEMLSLFGPATTYFDLSPAIQVTGLSMPEAKGRLNRFVAISRSIYRHCNKSRHDVVVLVDTLLFLFCLPWSCWSPSRFICWEHFHLGTEHGSRFRVMARKAAARWSDAIVVLTERDAQAWQRRFAGGGRVSAIANPLPRFDVRPSASSDRGNRVLAVGRLTEQKGFDVLLMAWRHLGELRQTWQLRIVGSGECEARLKQLARDLNIADSVCFVGQTKAVAREYREASIYVMSSRWEGLPMTLLEAQYFGLPSVATDCETGPREVLAGGSGLLVPVDNVQALASAVGRLIGDRHLRERLGQAALRNSLRYCPDNVRRSWVSLLGKLDRPR